MRLQARGGTLSGDEMVTASGALLAERIRTELLAVPLEHWSQLYPVQLALWRFLEEVRPGTLALKRAGSDEDGPYFVGSGADWFCAVLWNDEAIELGFAVLGPVVIHLKNLPTHPFDLVTAERLPQLDPAACGALAALACERVDTTWAEHQSHCVLSTGAVDRGVFHTTSGWLGAFLDAAMAQRRYVGCT